MLPQPQPYSPGPRPGAHHAPRRLRNRKSRPALAALGVLIIVLAAVVVIAKVTSGPGTITAHGTLEVAVSMLDGDTPSEAYPDISDGGQVTPSRCECGRR